MPEETQKELEQNFNKFFGNSEDNMFTTYSWDNIKNDFLVENHEGCTKYPFIGELQK